MLGLLFSLGLSVFLVYSSMYWYSGIWGLCLVVLFSLLIIYTPSYSYDLFSSYLSGDTLSSVLVCLTVWISVLMLLASQQVQLTKNNTKVFCLTILVLCCTLLYAFLMSNVYLFYFFFEASLIPTLVLILGWGYQPERLQAGMYMMMYTLSASLPLLLVLVWMVGINKSGEIFVAHSIRDSGLSKSYLNILMSLAFFVAFMVKLPVFGMHLWLPKAHVEAPVAGSMVLAAILLKLGGFGLLRVYQYANYSYSNVVILFMVLALIGGVITSVVCFRQVDLKALIAYSSIGHMSLVLAGIFLDTSWGWFASLLLMAAHGFCSSALFALANFSYQKTSTRSLYLTKGLLLSSPVLSLAWFMFASLNMAAPPSINLVGEIFVYAAGLSSSAYYGIPIGIMSFLAALFSMYLYMQTQHGGTVAYVSPHSGLKSVSMNVLWLHWIPANFFILKVHLLYLWL
uniref:NADH-ubiquinone oxidoreductase chain 4 n=1 Tax=Thylacodes squamigerus TaxID=766170 RepID=E2FLV4_9CAEN|nr:NADH dehydrogenase subunit 4 [Thylacodes squamigerus]ADI79420.1 NADH dehydrogenase subunit 4 [Thylacodes squamigerus]